MSGNPIYARAAELYWNSGWRGVLPVPPRRKKTPPDDYTGNRGIFPSFADITAWAEDKPEWNICLRLPRGVIGVDVDAYGDKHGAAALRTAEDRWGPLPPTWISTSKDDGISGIRLYRIPEGVRLRDRVDFGPGLGNIEICQFHHRYVMCWPSIHPSGLEYNWLRQDTGAGLNVIPEPDRPPWLPDAWIRGLEVPEPAISVQADVQAVLDSLPPGRMSVQVERLLDKSIEALGTHGSRHDNTRDNVLRLLRLAEQGEPGVDQALERLKDAYADAITDRATEPEAWREYDRMVTGQNGHDLIASNPSTENLLGIRRSELPVSRTPSVPGTAPPNIDNNDSTDVDAVLFGPAREAESEEEIKPSYSGARLWRAGSLNASAHQNWLAESRIPAGSVVLLTGDEGIGKSLFWAWLVALITTGRACPEFGIPEREPQNVRLVLTEADWATCARPRLEAAGADLTRVWVICAEQDGSGAPIFPADMDLVEDGEPYALCVVDCWLDTIPAGIRVQNPAEARKALHPWKEAAQHTGATMLLLTHTNRVASANPRDRYGITGELRKKARSTLFAQQDEETGVILLGPEKSNVSAPVAASQFRIVTVTHPIGSVPCLQLLGPSGKTMREHMHESFVLNAGEVDTQDCRRWLREYLTKNHGSADAKAVTAAAGAEGFSRDQIGRAKRRLGITSKKHAMDGGWLWLLP